MRKGRAVGYVESEETRVMRARKRASWYIYSTTGRVISLYDEPVQQTGPHKTITEMASECGLPVFKGKVGA